MSLQLVRQYHESLPEHIREYLRLERGISDAVVDLALLGWDGRRITIPIFNRDGISTFFKLAKAPDDTSNTPKMLAPPGTHAELYGWERLQPAPPEITICEGEFDRLVLESHGFRTVTSTGGTGVFRREWPDYFKEIPMVYVCFDRDLAGNTGARKVAQLIPHARIVQLPEGLGESGDVTDFFVRLGRSEEESRQLLERAKPMAQETVATAPSRPGPLNEFRKEVEDLKRGTNIENIASRYLELRPNGRTYIGRCPFHGDQHPSFVIYPDSQSFYCFGCLAYGDVITFLMQIEHLTFPEALKLLRKLALPAA
jgi:DNA primase